MPILNYNLLVRKPRAIAKLVAPLLIGSAIALVRADHSRAADHFICHEDKSVGFAYDSRTSSWHSAEFHLEGPFELRSFDLAGKDRKIAPVVIGYHAVESLGFFDDSDNSLLAFCEKKEEETFLPNYICKAFIATSVEFNRNTSAFQIYESGTYIDMPEGQRPDTPSLSIGHCMPLVPTR